MAPAPVAPPPGWQQQPRPQPAAYDSGGRPLSDRELAQRQAETRATAPPPATLPPGMTPEVWATLSPEAQTALTKMAGRQ